MLDKLLEAGLVVVLEFLLNDNVQLSLGPAFSELLAVVQFAALLRVTFTVEVNLFGKLLERLFLRGWGWCLCSLRCNF